MPPRPALLALAAAYFVLGVASLCVVGLVLQVGADLGTGPGAVALLVTAFALTYALAAPLAQMALGGWDRRLAVLLGLCVLGLGLLGSAMAPSYGWLFAARMAMAAGAALVGPMASAAAAALATTPQARGAALGAVFSGMTLATVLGVPLSGWLGALIGWRATMEAVAVAAFLAALATWRLLPAGSRGVRVTPAALRETLADRAVGFGIGVTLFQMAAQFATYALISAWLLGRFGVAPALVPVALAVFGLGGVAGNALAARLLLRVAPAPLIGGGLACFALVLLGLAVAPAVPALALLGLFLWAAVAISPMAPTQARLIELAPGQRNLVLALNAAALYLGMAAGAALSGLAFAVAGAGALPWASLAMVALAGLCFRLSRQAEREGPGMRPAGLEPATKPL